MAKDKEVERGKAVQQQLRVWDVLLEIRIRLQKMLVEANTLPQEERIWSAYEASAQNNSSASSKTVKSTIDKVKERVVKLKSATETETAYELPSHTLNQIQQITGDKERLLRRTQLKRTKYEIIGMSKEGSAIEEGEKMEVGEEYDPEIFDDDDFYHQILRELIERKTSNVTDPVQLSRHWLELQKLRSKTKRKVDTKASKARKIRYEVYPKLVNLMAPADEGQMTEHAVNELFQSLFGGSLLSLDMSIPKPDPRRADRVRRYRNSAITFEDFTSDYMSVIGMLFSMFGLMMRMKWCAWVAIYCSCIGFASSRLQDDAKQIFSSFMLSISAVVMSYLQNPVPMILPLYQ